MKTRMKLAALVAAAQAGMSKAADHVSGRTAMVALAGVGAVLPSFAQTATDPFDQAVTDVTTKINAYGPKLVALAAVGVIFVVALKYVKKIPRAS